MRDFTLHTYQQLLSTLKEQNFNFQPFVDFLRNPAPKSLILRHDVDARKMNSLCCAQLEQELGITGTYYFRMVPQSFDEKVIKQIAELGHEIGYHYEDLSFTAQRLRAKGSELRAQSSGHAEEELVKIAIESFRDNLAKLRRIVPVQTICMHGSPLSRWDNRLLWKYYDYRDFGIVGEPYFDIDFEKVLYLTDTGRRWDGGAVAIRDKVTEREGLRDLGTERRRDKKWGEGDEEKGREELGDLGTKRRRDKKGRDEEHLAPCTLHPATLYKFQSTFDIINAAKENLLPDRIMLTIHPQRWDDRPLPWVRELVWQNVKNAGKWILRERRRAPTFALRASVGRQGAGERRSEGRRDLETGYHNKFSGLSDMFTSFPIMFLQVS